MVLEYDINNLTNCNTSQKFKIKGMYFGFVFKSNDKSKLPRKLKKKLQKLNSKSKI